MTQDTGSRPGTSSDQDLVLALAVTIRTAAYYDADNSVTGQACSGLATLLADYCKEEESVTVGVQSHCVFVGRSRVRITVSTYERFSYIIQLFESWGIKTLAFFQGVSEEELLQVALVLAREKASGAEGLAEMLIARGVSRVKVDIVMGTGTAQAVAPVEAYAAAMQMSDELSTGMDSGEPLQVRRLRHVTQAVVDQILRDPGSLVALTTIKDFDRYLISHSTNVAVLSVLLGQRLGLSKSRLGELCLAAFLHDAGKLEVLPDVLHKRGALNTEEWEEMRRHPVLAAYSLLGAGRCAPSNMMAVVVAFEHHLNHDLSGYPTTELKDGVSLFGSIVAVADRYDALTTARVYREYNYTPHEALSYLISNAGTLFDPILVKLFVEMMGIYPPGTLVELSSGDVAVVCAAPPLGTPLDRPTVRLVAGVQAGQTLDLRSKNGDAPALSISRVMNPANKGQMPAVDLTVFETAT